MLGKTIARLLFVFINFAFSQSIDTIQLNTIPMGSIVKTHLNFGVDNFGVPRTIPVLVAKGKTPGPVLGLTAAIHGNELNGIAIIHKLFDTLDVTQLSGTVIAIPGLNPVGISDNTRDFKQEGDLNRIFPGKKNGSYAEQWVHNINTKVLPLFNFHIDLHTASFGRINSLYVRADVKNDTLFTLAKLLEPDIILNNKGNPSFGSEESKTLRAAALEKGIHSVTVEYGDPQVFQTVMISRGVNGILNIMAWLGMLTEPEKVKKLPVICKKSYWMYTDAGGYLEVLVELNQVIEKGAPIAIVRNAVGDKIKEYYAPESGIVIGKSTNPVAMSGDRILHLGILDR